VASSTSRVCSEGNNGRSRSPFARRALPLPGQVFEGIGVEQRLVELSTLKIAQV
jgi:hypothetical protein